MSWLRSIVASVTRASAFAMKLPRLKNNILRDPAGVVRELTRGICVFVGEATADMRFEFLPLYIAC